MFRRIPHAFAPLMGALVGSYRSACDAALIQPDEALLAPIEAVLATLPPEPPQQSP